MPSSVIKRFEYDPAHTALDVFFISGRRYRYFDVPPMLVDKFSRATSKGHFFNTRIRNRFDYQEVRSQEVRSRDLN